MPPYLLMPPVNPDSLAHVIQLALAPVFLLTAVSALIGALTNRLARIIDRARKLEDALDAKQATLTPALREELVTLAQRAGIINRSMILLVTSAICIGITVVGLFVGNVSTLNASKVVPWFFIAGMTCFILSLVSLLREVLLATRGLKIGARLLDANNKPD
jgi:hypothetical protein